MELHTLGIDPAKSGAATLLAPGPKAVLLAGWVWHECQRQGQKVFKVTCWNNGKVEGPYITGTMNGIGSMISRTSRDITQGKAWDLGAEEAVVGRARDTSIIVARNSGMVVGPCEPMSTGQRAAWVRATDWRMLLLGLHFKTKREEAKEASLQRMPMRVQGLQEALDVLGQNDDLTDAAGVSEWRRLLVNNPSLVRKRKTKAKKSSEPGSSSGRKRNRRKT